MMNSEKELKEYNFLNVLSFPHAKDSIALNGSSKLKTLSALPIDV